MCVCVCVCSDFIILMIAASIDLSSDSPNKGTSNHSTRLRRHIEGIVLIMFPLEGQ